MNVERMTQRVQEALNAAYTRALSEHNTQTTPEHLLAAILDQTEGIATPILEKAGLDPRAVDQRLQAAIAALPRYQGANADQNQVTVAPALTRLLGKADDEAKSLNDDYVSVEHLLLAMTSDAGAVGKLFRDLGLSREKLLAALRDVRGNQRVTTQNPEGTYQSLERYGRDLTELARRGKLDPVIGRDEEIRRVIQSLARRIEGSELSYVRTRIARIARMQPREVGVEGQLRNRPHGKLGLETLYACRGRVLRHGIGRRHEHLDLQIRIAVQERVGVQPHTLVEPIRLDTELVGPEVLGLESAHRVGRIGRAVVEAPALEAASRRHVHE